MVWVGASSGILVVGAYPRFETEVLYRIKPRVVGHGYHACEAIEMGGRVRVERERSLDPKVDAGAVSPVSL
jgi:hypothetical protein